MLGRVAGPVRVDRDDALRGESKISRVLVEGHVAPSATQALQAVLGMLQVATARGDARHHGVGHFVPQTESTSQPASRSHPLAREHHVRPKGPPAPVMWWSLRTESPVHRGALRAWPPVTQ